jgi:predicted outer membrane repeat protein
MRVARTPPCVLVCFLSALVAGAAASEARVAKPSNLLIRVPKDAKTLDAAIGRVGDGGVIEMAKGTYPSPPTGFSINNTRKGFTIRAAAGATVAIDGGGTRNLVRFVNSDRARGKKVIFQQITFQNGYSARLGESGGVTLSAAEALFRQCSFVNNRAANLMTGGGAVKALPGSSATFMNCSFHNNSSPLRGGAIVVRGADVTIQGGELVGNRTNLLNHQINSFGGAIVVIDGTLTVSGVRFDGNQAGWTGGAIYAIGNWDKGSTVSVSRSTFTGNLAVPDPCCVNPVPTSGGAIHAEDLTTLTVADSLFQRNGAAVGGAVDGYRADAEISGSVFQANNGAGGAISMVSGDSADSSTAGGTINRRSARLVVTRSLLQGGPQASSTIGGCILAGGDGNRMYGDGGITPDGTLADNRAQVQIRGVVFSGCHVAAAADGGIGGALDGELIDLDLEDSMILDSDARGANAGGGALALRQESNALILRTTFARDSADKWGGALFLSGSTLLMDGCRFYGNDVVPGVSEGLSDSRGAAIYSIPSLNPARLRNVGGVLANSVFSENLGIPVWDVDPASGPTNEMRYDGNRFALTTFGDRVYVDNLASPGGANAGTLNVLVVDRGSRGVTAKSAVPNLQIGDPSEGDLRVVPSPAGVGAGTAAPTVSVLAFAWSGRSAVIGPVPLQKTGLLDGATPGSYTLTVDGIPAATASATGSFPP